MTEADTQGEWYHELEVGRRRWPWWGWIPVAIALAGVFVWWALHPEELPRREGEISLTLKEGQTTYIGLIGREAEGAPRAIDLREVSFESADEGLEIEALICRGGAIGSTTDPTEFCQEVDQAEGEITLGGSDQLMASLTGSEAGTFTVEDVEISYRDGLQFGSSSTGLSIVAIVFD